MKCVDRLVVGDIPTFGNAWYRLKRFGMPSGESLEETVDDTILRRAGYDCRVEALHFAFVDKRKIGRRQARAQRGPGDAGEQQHEHTPSDQRARVPRHSQNCSDREGGNV